MRSREATILSALALLIAVGQLVAIHGGSTVTLVAGFVSGMALVAGVSLFALSLEQPYLSPCIASAASLLGLVAAAATSEESFPAYLWATPLLAALVPGVLAIVDAHRAPRCHLCRRPIRRALSFSCPRCHLRSCEYCWQFEKCRCRLCLENQIPLFSKSAKWWMDHFGEPSYTGKCGLCLTPVKPGAPLRACRNCHHGQCQACWDDNNGECVHCGWTVEDLPQDVMDYVALGRTGRNKPLHKRESNA